MIARDTLSSLTPIPVSVDDHLERLRDELLTDRARFSMINESLSGTIPAMPVANERGPGYAMKLQTVIEIAVGIREHMNILATSLGVTLPPGKPTAPGAFDCSLQAQILSLREDLEDLGRMGTICETFVKGSTSPTPVSLAQLGDGSGILGTLDSTFNVARTIGNIATSIASALGTELAA